MSLMDNFYKTRLRAGKDTYREYPSEKTIHELFEEQAERTPDRTAVSFKGKSLTYRELNSQANQLARVIRRMGILPDHIVALMVDRSLDTLVSILAILKAGGAFLPIDPHFPNARIDYMLSDSQTRLLITQRTLQAKVNEVYTGQTIILDDEVASHEDTSNLPHTGDSRCLMDVIYTSGSTGKPKGVMIEHRAVHNFIVGMTDVIDFDPDYTIVSLTTISFDIFILETLLPLTRGMRIVIADPREFHAHVGKERIDMLQTTPSTMLLLQNDEANLKTLRDLKVIMLGGEPFPTVLLEKLKDITGARIYNMYGPTETTIWSSVKELTHEQEITIGWPIANTQFYILDPNRTQLPPGEMGELYISGDGVARGYLHKPELTGERFVTQHIGDAEVIMYRTGDLARLTERGEYTFHGRVDNQVKIRGFRMELGEIEERLSRFDGLKECAVTARENKTGENYLAAYYVADEPIEASQLIRHLAKDLPEYMIPGFYIRMEAIPLTPNGKLDRRSLPEPDSSRPMLETAYVSPATAIEKQLVELWGEILGLDLIGVHDNFFELGGNSILLSVMHVEIKRRMDEQLTLPDLFSYPTIAKLADYMMSSRSTSPAARSTAVSLPRSYGGYDPAGPYAGLKYRLAQGDYAGLLKICSFQGVELLDVLAGVWGYILSEVSGTKQIPINVLCKDREQVQLQAIPVDYGQSRDLSQLFTLFHEARQAAGADLLPLEAMRHVIPQGEQVYPMVCLADGLQEDFGRLFGVAVGFRQEATQGELLFKYDGSRFGGGRMKELLTTYIKALKAICTIYQKRWSQ
ncbi:non-ribosomal peptide synthetase [Gorillibacterium sp. sgz500922]|uniref:non-ribosomal peptide synthetase n=1 Tax=Gorillibacterium sp. sgz500922 TaxID=3446694 RepID=UPI003F6679EA